jgi:serine/threonine-protein kinase
MPLILDSRYVPLKQLGQGGFGTTFLARDRRMPAMRQCVVKLFQPSGKLTPSQLEVAQELFEREAEALEDLGNTHPQIPDLYAFFELTVPSLLPNKMDRFFYIVQEFIDGQTLEEELAADGPFSIAQVTEMLAAILPVLTFVHQNNTIHRDIKPSNIMRRHSDGQFNLLDFGAVRQAAKGRFSTIFSPGYAPPEQVDGKDVSPSSDLYALAVTCIVLMTGKPPEELGLLPQGWQWRSRVPDLTDPLATVLDRMLRSNPEERFQSASTVLAALQQPSSPVTAASGTGSQLSGGGGSHPSSFGTPTLPPITLTSIPGQPPVPPQIPPPPPPPPVAPFSMLESLGGVTFTGFESALLAIASFSLPLPLAPWSNAGLWLLVSAGMVYCQRRRIIERIDLVIIAGLTLTIVLFFPALYGSVRWLIPFIGHASATIVIIAVMVGAGVTCTITLFRLIYKLLSRWF